MMAIKREKGFTLMEVLAAMGIFSIAILGLAVGATSVMKANHTSYLASIATNLAQDKLEELKAKPASLSSCASNCDNPVPTYHGVTFTRTWTVTTNTPVPGVQQVDITVNWTDYTNHSQTVSAAVKP